MNQTILLILFTCVFFFYIKEDDYIKMISSGLAFLILSHLLNNSPSPIYEKFGDSAEFTEQEEEERSREAQYDDSTAQEQTTEETEEDVPLPANTPFVSAEYATLRDKARDEEKPVVTDKNDTPEGDGPTDPEPISSEETFEEKNIPKLTVVKDKFRIGPYDGLCISSNPISNKDLIKNEELVTLLGVQGPMEILTSQDVLKGPTVDGTKDTPQKLTMFANNKVNFKCCGESPFTTSSGCICLTDNQKEFIRSRGFNKNYNDI